MQPNRRRLLFLPFCFFGWTAVPIMNHRRRFNLAPTMATVTSGAIISATGALAPTRTKRQTTHLGPLHYYLVGRRSPLRPQQQRRQQQPTSPGTSESCWKNRMRRYQDGRTIGDVCSSPITISARFFAGVTGSVYTADDSAVAESDNGSVPPLVCLFTKEGCTLCDKVKDVLAASRGRNPHSLYQIDITDKEHRDWFDKYKYDIPVLHLNGNYWTKHRLSTGDVEQAFGAVSKSVFESPPGEPNAGKSQRD